MTKIDFKKTMRQFYNPPKKFGIVDLPQMQFIMVDGHGLANEQDNPDMAQKYKDAIEALYAVAYKMKFISKISMEKDYVVPPLEGLWWAEDMDTFITREKSAWDWTMMIMVPDWITAEVFEDALEQVRKKKNPTALSKVRLENYHEGLAVQIMHIGSYDDEGPVLAKMHAEFIPSNGYAMRGKHHEIYLSDPRRVAPEKLKTVLRQPIK